MLAENNYLLASSRRIDIAKRLDQDEAWNYGASTSAYIPLFGKTLNLNAEYYYTDFSKQVVVDMDTDPHAVLFYNLHGRSYSQVVWYLIANPRGLPKEFVQKELEFRWKLFPEKKEETK